MSADRPVARAPPVILPGPFCLGTFFSRSRYFCLTIRAVFQLSAPLQSISVDRDFFAGGLSPQRRQPTRGEGGAELLLGDCKSTGANSAGGADLTASSREFAATPWVNGVHLEALANLAHELRTPVQVLRGYLEILQGEYAEQIPEEPARIVERMSVNLNQLAQTLENV